MSNTSDFINKIIIDFQKGKKESSFNKLKEFVKINPNDETAKYNLAVMSEQLNKIEFAKSQYNEILSRNSKHWKSKFNLYLIYINEKNYLKALNLVDEVLEIKNNYQPALRDKGIILYYLKKPEESLPFIESAIKQNNNDYIALNALGLIYLEFKKINLAIKIFEKTISINEKYFPSYNNLGRCFDINNQKNLALKNYKKAFKLNPKFTEAINNIANYYNQTGLYNKAIEYYNEALKIDPEKPELIYNKGLAYAYLGKYKRAEELYMKAYKVLPNDDQLKKNYAVLLLANQRFEEAWKFFDGRIGLNEFSLKNSQVNRVRKKLWNNEKINANDNLLIIKEQGIGDEILYGSMYGDLLKKFNNVKIETEPRLISLFEKSFNKKNIFVPFAKFSNKVESLKKFDYIIYAGSLGKLFRNNISDFNKKNFLIADKNKTQKISKKINRISKKIKIGISWRSKNETYGIDKSVDLNLFLPILNLDKFSFINLQYGNTKEELYNFKKNSNIEILNIDAIDLFNDFESIAALLKSLDLYIAVSNSTAHLAASLGVPTWIIKPKIHAVFHYWNQPSNKTPWYESVRLFSQEEGLEKTIQEIKKELLKKFI